MIASGFHHILSIRAGFDDKTFIVGGKNNNDQIWVTNSSSRATFFLKDISFGPSGTTPAMLTPYKNHMYFLVNESGGRALWRSDGTDEGTRVFIELNPGNNNIVDIAVFQNYLYFSTAAGKLFRTDGNPQNITLVDQHSGLIRWLTASQDFLYYFKGTSELYRTDGDNVISLPSPLNDQTIFDKFVTAENSIFCISRNSYGERTISSFSAESLTWTIVHADDTRSEAAPDYAIFEENLFFGVASDLYPYNVSELWRSDGTVAGTSFVKAVGSVSNFFELSGKLFFLGSSGLWTSGGTVESTVPLVTIPTNHVMAIDTAIFFGGRATEDESNNEGALYYYHHGKDTTIRYAEGLGFPLYMANGAGAVYFTIHDNSSYDGMSLWSTNPAPDLRILNQSQQTTIPNHGHSEFTPTSVYSCNSMLLTLQNPNIKELALRQIQVIGKDFHIEADIPAFIKAKGSIDLPIYFTPMSAGQKEGLLKIFSNDADTPIYTISLAGETSGSSTDFCSSVLMTTKILKPEIKYDSITLTNAVIDELLDAGTIVGKLEINCSAENLSFRFAKGFGDDSNNLFSIEGNELKTAYQLNYVTGNVHSVRITAIVNDTIYSERNFQITVNNVAWTTDESNCGLVSKRFSYSFKDVEINSLGQFFAITNTGLLRQSNDNGLTWSTVNLGAKGDLYKIIFKNSTGFILGESSFKSNDNGLTWTRVDIPTTASGVSFFSSTSGYVTTRDGITLFTADGGSTWNEKSRQDFSISSPFFWTPESGVALSGNSGLVKTLDGGLSWQTMNMGGIYGIVSSIVFINSNVGFVCTHETLYRTINGGSNWTIVFEQFFGQSTIEFVSSEVGYIYGNILYKTTDGGTTWLALPNAVPGITGLAINPTDNKLYLSHKLGEGRCITTSADQGNTWEMIADFQFEASFSSLNFITKDIGYALGYFPYKTLDGGNNWQKLEVHKYIEQGHFFDQLTGVVYDGTTVYKTDDGLQTLRPILEDFTTSKFFPASGDLIFIARNNALWKSEDKGENWRQVDANFETFDLDFVSETVGYRIDLTSTIQKSIDRGETWTEVSGTHGDYPFTRRSISFVNENIGYRSDPFLGKTIDGGITWTDVPTPLANTILEIYFINELHGFARTNWGVYETFDGGTQWKSAEINNTAPLANVNFQEQYITVIDQQGIAGKIEATDEVPPLPAIPQGLTTLCVGDVATYELPDEIENRYHWNVQNADVEDHGSSADIYFPTSGEYKLELKQFDGCAWSDSRTITINVIDMASPQIEGVDSVYQPGQLPYTITNAQPFSEYVWHVDNGSTIPTDVSGSINVKWENAVGESGKLSVMAIEPESGCWVRGQDFIVKLNIIVANNKDEEEETSTVFPNPTHDTATIPLASRDEKTIELYNISGTLLLSEEITGSTLSYTVDLKDKGRGVYLVLIYHKNSGVIIKKKILRN
jgi:ELWxxDGT repeat protein